MVGSATSGTPAAFVAGSVGASSASAASGSVSVGGSAAAAVGAAEVDDGGRDSVGSVAGFSAGASLGFAMGFGGGAVDCRSMLAQVLGAGAGVDAGAEVSAGAGADGASSLGFWLSQACDSSVGTESALLSGRVPFVGWADRPRGAVRPPLSAPFAAVRPRVLSGPAPPLRAALPAAASPVATDSLVFGFARSFFGLETSSHCEMVPILRKRVWLARKRGRGAQLVSKIWLFNDANRADESRKGGRPSSMRRAARMMRVRPPCRRTRKLEASASRAINCIASSQGPRQQQRLRG